MLEDENVFNGNEASEFSYIHLRLKIWDNFTNPLLLSQDLSKKNKVCRSHRYHAGSMSTGEATSSCRRVEEAPAWYCSHRS